MSFQRRTQETSEGTATVNSLIVGHFSSSSWNTDVPTSIICVSKAPNVPPIVFYTAAENNLKYMHFILLFVW